MRRILLAILVAATVPAAGATDLITVFERAQAADPQLREADANRMAQRESKPQALAALLPQISGSASAGRTDSDVISSQPQRLETPPGSGNFAIVNSVQSTTSDSDAERWSIDLRQAVFSWADWVALRRADKQVAQAEADYAAAQQELILRVSRAYFDVLAAQDNVEAQQSNLDAISRQLEQSEKRFEVGLIAITDVEESRAARDSAAAALIAAKRQLASAEEALREITDERYTQLLKPAETMPLKSPDPVDVEKWVELSMNQNLALTSTRLAADIARDNVRTAFSGHLPRLDLVASKSNLDVDGDGAFLFAGARQPFATGRDSDELNYQLQLSVPIFSGGATRSATRQSEFLWIAAKERLERVSRQTERLARDAFLGVESEISRVRALRQALESSQTALKATEAGFEVGTRTTVDVLNARGVLVQAQTNYARSRYDYILNVLQLRLAAGTLDRAALEEVNGWLQKR